MRADTETTFLPFPTRMWYSSLNTYRMCVFPVPTRTHPLKSTQTLDTPTPARPPFHERLRALRWVCGARRILPGSYALSSTPLITDSHPVASGAVADTYKGTFNGRKVCVKRVRVYSNGNPRGVQEVRHLFLPSCILSSKGSRSFIRKLSCGSTGSM